MKILILLDDYFLYAGVVTDFEVIDLDESNLPIL